jgi:predicted HD phosphohydrolase
MNEIARTDTRVAAYTDMADGTREDYLLLKELAAPFRARLADRVLAYLEELHEGFPGERVDRYEHSLQTATRAFRAGADEETVVAGLLHDIGDRLAPDNHAEFAATVLKPYVTPATYWLVLHHGIFQGYFFWHHYGKDRNLREKFRGHPCYEATRRFTDEWDSKAFDPRYDTMPIQAFEPMVRRILGRPAWGPHTKERAEEIKVAGLGAEFASSTAGAAAA